MLRYSCSLTKEATSSPLHNLPSTHMHSPHLSNSDSKYYILLMHCHASEYQSLLSCMQTGQLPDIKYRNTGQDYRYYRIKVTVSFDEINDS